MRQNIDQSAQKVVSQQGENLSKWSASKIGLPVGLLVVVCIAVAATHWPVLSAQALTFDDHQYLTENLLVQNPSWTSARRRIRRQLELYRQVEP